MQAKSILVCIFFKYLSVDERIKRVETKYTNNMRLLFMLFAVALFVPATIHAEEPQNEPRPTAYLVCNAHLDTQWKWDIETTIKEFIPRVLFQNIYLMERYPDYRFSFEGGVKYQWMKEYYPMHYERMKHFIASGQWHVAGASWEANDTNIPSPESAFRNILLGQEFYKREFGVKSRDIFLPDCFGFSYTLPTIAAHAGLIGFSTQKLNWRTAKFYDDEQQPKNPFSWGVWQGIDSQSLIAAFDTGIYSEPLPEDVQHNEQLIARAKRGFDNVCYRYYSGEQPHTGDRGNTGTVITCQRLWQALRDQTADVKIISAKSDDLFLDYIDRKAELPHYQGELLMDLHGVGCYTSQAAMKYLNRRNEELVLATERAAVAADLYGEYPYPSAKMEEIWRRFIWHQFHDDLTGTSIPKAYTYSWNDELIALSQSEDVMTTAVAALSYRFDTDVQGVPVVVYNPVTMEVNSVVEVEIPLSKDAPTVAVYSPEGKRVKSQILRREGDKAVVAFAAECPSAGYVVYDIRAAQKEIQSSLKISKRTIENSLYRLTVDSAGDIISIIDKRCGRELVAEGGAIRPVAIRGNKSNTWPAWEIHKSVIDSPSEPLSPARSITISERGPLRATLRIERMCGESLFVQYITLRDGADEERIDIRNEVDWRENDILLKAEFPLSVANAEATYDLGMGHIRRGNNTVTAHEVPAYKWADITTEDGAYGVSILNDAKYGWDKPSDNTLRLTLFHNPTSESRYPEQNVQDHGRHIFTYSILAHKGSSLHSTIRSAEQLNMKALGYVTPKHAGDLGRRFSMVASSSPQIMVAAMKAAEDFDGYIVRCYERDGKSAEGVAIEFPAPIISAEECNAIEERMGDCRFEGNRLYVSTTPFSPKTYRVKFAEVERGEGFVEHFNLTLPLDVVAFSTDEFSTYYRFDPKGESYAAELIPSRIECCGINFVMGEQNDYSAMFCNGKTIEVEAQKDSRLYLLVASTDGDRRLDLRLSDGTMRSVEVPYWKGFYGQWGWREYNEGYIRDATLAHVGTHRHNMHTGNVPYGFSYIYMVGIDIPAGTKSITLPEDKHIAIFAATLSDDSLSKVIASDAVELAL